VRKLLSALLVVCLLANLTGCETLKKKFTRKKKAVVKIPKIYQTKMYYKKPAPELYKKHFSYWDSWHSELIKTLGKNHKKDVKCVEESVNNLKDMQNLLLPEKADRLGGHIDKLVKVKEIIFKEDLTQFNKNYVLMTLEREDRAIKREFKYTKVKDYIRKEPDAEEESENEK